MATGEETIGAKRALWFDPTMLSDDKGIGVKSSAASLKSRVFKCSLFTRSCRRPFSGRL